VVQLKKRGAQATMVVAGGGVFAAQPSLAEAFLEEFARRFDSTMKAKIYPGPVPRQEFAPTQSIARRSLNSLRRPAIFCAALARTSVTSGGSFTNRTASVNSGGEAPIRGKPHGGCCQQRHPHRPQQPVRRAYLVV
jgi:hypothetical protein